VRTKAGKRATRRVKAANLRWSNTRGMTECERQRLAALDEVARGEGNER
jgi:hypothetical protein